MGYVVSKGRPRIAEIRRAVAQGWVTRNGGVDAWLSAVTEKPLFGGPAGQELMVRGKAGALRREPSAATHPAGS